MRLTVHDPSGARVSIPFAGESLTVGRQDGNDVLLRAPSVSRHHCRLVRTARGVELEDLGSTGGVFVDGTRIGGRVPLLPGQPVGVGPYTLVLEAGEFVLRQPGEALLRHWRLGPRQARNDEPAWEPTRVVGR